MLKYSISEGHGAQRGASARVLWGRYQAQDGKMGKISLLMLSCFRNRHWNHEMGFKDTERTWVSVALTRTWLQMGLEWDSWTRWLGRHSWFLESIWEIPSSHRGGRERNPLEWNTNNDQGKTEHRKKREREEMLILVHRIKSRKENGLCEANSLKIHLVFQVWV